MTVRAGIIPIRLSLDLFEVGIAGEAADALGGECIPGAAEGIDDGIVGVEQAMAQVPLAQEQPEPLDCVSMLPLSAGLLMRADLGSAARIWSRSPPAMVTSQMCWPPRVASRPRRRPWRSQR